MDYQGFKAIEPTGFFRGVAREALRGRWGLAFGAGFLYMILINLPVTIFDSLFGSQLDVADLYNSYGESSSMSQIYMDEYINASSGISSIYALFTYGAFTLGMTILVIHIVRRANAGAGMIFSGFGNYFRSLGILVLIALICFGVMIVAMLLASMLLFSGSDVMIGVAVVILILMFAALIIIYLVYGLSYYVLADNPKMGVVSCMRMSRKMMKGNKGKLFLLYLSFIGWVLLYFLAAVLVGTVIGIFMLFASSTALNIVSSIIGSLGGGILTVYVLTAEAAFYEKVSGISSGIFNLSNEELYENPTQGPDYNQNNYLDSGNNDKPRITSDDNDEK